MHGDQAVPERNPGPALNGLGVEAVLESARRSADTDGLSAGDRVMSVRPWSTPAQVIGNLLAVLVAGGSLVQVSHPDAAVLERRRETEKVTRTME